MKKNIPSFIDFMNESRRLTDASLCAKEIRTKLKNLFPNQKFSVTSDTYSGGDSVRVSWTDGVALSKVSPIVAQYQMGNFNGMIDMYEYDDEKPKDIEYQVKYTFANREISESIINSIIELVDDKINISDKWEKERYFYRKIREIINNIDIPNGASKVVSVDESIFFSNSYNEADCVKCFVFNVEAKSNIKEPKSYESKPSKAKDEQEIEEIGDISIVDYSDKTYAIIGNTYPIKDKLKEINARFNKFLNINGEKKAGWIITKNNKEELLRLLGE